MRKQSLEFWNWFVAQAGDLALMDPEEAVNLIHEHLQLIDSHLGCEICKHEAIIELVFTASGHTGAFPLVRDLVAAAPAVVGWKYVALKQAKGFDFKVKNRLHALQAAVLTFEFLDAEDDPQALGIRIYVPSPVPDDEEFRHLLWLALETGLGEEAASRISYVDARSEVEAREGFPQLKDLAHFINWKIQRRKSGLA